MKLNLPDDVARELAEAASAKGMSTESFALEALREAARRSTDDVALMDRIVTEAQMLRQEDTVSTAESFHEASTDRLPPF